MTDSDQAWTFVLDIHHPPALPPAAAGRITGDDYVVAHLERPGAASVRAMLNAALERGHISIATPVGANADMLPVAAVVVMGSHGAAHETWEVPSAEGLAWWVDVADFRTVTRERYRAAFPRIDGDGGAERE